MLVCLQKGECIYHTPRDILTDRQNSTILRDEAAGSFTSARYGTINISIHDITNARKMSLP
jgi:hypothetical protein